MFRKISLRPALLAALCIAGCSNSDDPNHISKEMAKVRDYVPMNALIAHRGTTYWAPEETEASWRWAREMGADYLESDLQATKDGIVMANHDNTLKRTTDIVAFFGEGVPAVRAEFYRSFRNEDGSQHFTEEDIAAQIEADAALGTAYNMRDYYYAELLMLDAGSWFNTSNPDRARAGFASGSDRTTDRICYSSGQYVSALSDQIAFAEGKILNRDAEGRRVLPYHIKPGFENMTLSEIRGRANEQRGTIADGMHFIAEDRYMDFVEYDFTDAYVADPQDTGNRPGIYIEFKQATIQPSDMEARVFNILDEYGWNIITKPAAKNAPFWLDGKINVGNTSGKVILQSFDFEAVKRVEDLYQGRIPMCWLVEDEKPMAWDENNYYSTEADVADVIAMALKHKCHIMGPSVSGEPNNYVEHNYQWQEDMVREAGMISHPWSIDSNEQMRVSMDGFFTNRTDLSLVFLSCNGLRPEVDPAAIPSAVDVLDRLGY